MLSLKDATTVIWRKLLVFPLFGVLGVVATQNRAGDDGIVIREATEQRETSIWPGTNTEVLEYPAMIPSLRGKDKTIAANGADFSPKGVEKWLMDWERGLNPPHIEVPATPPPPKSSRLEHLKREIYGGPWACQAHTWQFGDLYGKDSRRILIPLEILLVLCGSLSVYLLWISKYCGVGGVAAAHRRRLSGLSQTEVDLSTRLNALEISCMEIARLEVELMNGVSTCEQHHPRENMTKKSRSPSLSFYCPQKSLEHALETRAATEKEIRALEKRLDQLSKPCLQEKALAKLTNHDIFGSWITYAVTLSFSTLVAGLTLASFLMSMFQDCTSTLRQARALLIIQWIVFALFAVVFPVVATIDIVATIVRLTRHASTAIADPGLLSHTTTRIDGAREESLYCRPMQQLPQLGRRDILEPATCPPGRLAAHHLPEALHVDTSNRKLLGTRASVASVASYETGDVSPTDTSPGLSNTARQLRLTSEVPSVVSPETEATGATFRAGPI